MSQHYFETTCHGDPVVVTLGWDRPLGHYFLFIERAVPQAASDAACTDEAAEADDDDGGVIYSNLNQSDAFLLDLDDYKSTLAELGITVPEAMFEQVAGDQARGTGNRYVWYSADGTFRESPLVA